MKTSSAAYEEVKRWLSKADGLLITAGAGMGVDSGLPDFRGDKGFWQHYPALATRGLGFREIANPQSFEDNPRLAWGFYGHRLNLYRQTKPHADFQILRDLAATKIHGSFVFTSNVDGQFQKAGFNNQSIVECHGSIHLLQCQFNCEQRIWTANGFEPQIDEAECQLTSPLPRCPGCGCVARPNILMFNDGRWLSEQTDRQYIRYQQWLKQVEYPVVIEIGAGIAIPTIRNIGKELTSRLIRINPADDHGNQGIHIQATALEGLVFLQNFLES